MFINQYKTTEDLYGHNTRCAKQHVIAIIISKDQEYFIGTNKCLSPQKKCPRHGLESGEGYHLCKDICRQVSHAEIAALNSAGYKAKDSVLILIGHTYCCDDCINKMLLAGVKQVIIV